LRNEICHSSSQNMTIKSITIKWVGHVARVEVIRDGCQMSVEESEIEDAVARSTTASVV
jgi:hypothetical protein